MVDGLDLTDVEREICRLPDVAIARIVDDAGGRITEVHVVARGPKHPKQVARDVQSVALASFGLELDRRIISVVQLGDDDTLGAPSDTAGADGVGRGSPRPVIEHVGVETAGRRAEVRIGLRLGPVDAVGTAVDSVASTLRHRLVAAAVIDALRQVQPIGDALVVDAAGIVRVGTHDVAVVTLVHVAPPAEHVLSGSAVVTGGNGDEAIARAVLDATNRRLGARG